MEFQRRNIYSQYGEDGIIERLIALVPTSHRFCVEFGAWDGMQLSNTFNLISKHGWRGVYIEGEAKRYKALLETARRFPSIIPVHAFVQPRGQDSLDEILAHHNVPREFELLSIDVDGADYDIWEGSTGFRPSIVVIEHNHSMPPGFRHIDRGGKGFIGSSATSLHELARKKNYDLVACTLTNSIFLRDDLFSSSGVTPTTVEEAFDRSEIGYVFWNSAGEIVFSNPNMAKTVKGVTYVGLPKRLKHVLLRERSVYILGEDHADAAWLTRLWRAARSLLGRE